MKIGENMHYATVKTILSKTNGMNMYRGCTHGCIYCDGRSKCYQFTHDFEDIEVKENAAELLRKTLASKRKKCMIGTGGMCDPYMHCEKQLNHTRKLLEIIDEFGFGLAIQTKSDLILRDLDLLKRINEKSKCVVQMTLTTYNDELCKIIEPNVCPTSKRFEALNILRENNIPTVVWMTPILPYINDTQENICGLLDYCVRAKVKGIITFGIGTTLRDGNREYFYDALDRHFKGLKSIYIREYGNAYEIVSPKNRELMSIFYQVCKENGIESNADKVFAYLHEFPKETEYEQYSFF